MIRCGIICLSISDVLTLLSYDRHPRREYVFNASVESITGECSGCRRMSSHTNHPESVHDADREPEGTNQRDGTLKKIQVLPLVCHLLTQRVRGSRGWRLLCLDFMTFSPPPANLQLRPVIKRVAPVTGKVAPSLRWLISPREFLHLSPAEGHLPLRRCSSRPNLSRLQITLHKQRSTSVC